MIDGLEEFTDAVDKKAREHAARLAKANKIWLSAYYELPGMDGKPLNDRRKQARNKPDE
jgi:hypothetical protein